MKKSLLIKSIDSSNYYLTQYLKELKPQNGNEDYLLSELQELSDMQTAIIKELKHNETDNFKYWHIKHLLNQLEAINGSDDLRTRDNSKEKYHKANITDVQQVNYDLVTQLAEELNIDLY